MRIKFCGGIDDNPSVLPPHAATEYSVNMEYDENAGRARTRRVFDNGAIRDVAERRWPLMADKICQLDFYAAVMDADPDAIVIQDGGRVIDCNKRALELLAVASKADIIGTHPSDFSPDLQPDGTGSRALVDENIARAMEKGSHCFDWVSRDMKGREFASEMWLTSFEWGGRTLLRAAIRDVEAHFGSVEQRTHAYFKSLFDNTPEGIVIVDDCDQIVDANPGFQKLFQYSRDEVVGRNLNDYIVPERLHGQAVEYSHRALDGVTDVISDTVRTRKDGFELRVSIMGAPVSIGGKQVGVCGIYRDMSVYFRNRERLRQTEERLRAVVDNLPVVLFMLDKDGVFTLSQGLGLKAMGREPDENVGRSIYEVSADQPQLIEGFKAALRGRTKVLQQDSPEAIFETQFSPLADDNGEITGVIGLARDITENREIKRRLEYMAHHDMLTGLPNRVFLRDRIKGAISRARQANSLFAILFVDLDRFKTINDSLGHAAGDRVLRTVAERFANAIRPTDVIARLGGDEFAVLIEEVKSPRATTVVAHKLTGALLDPIPEDDLNLNISASIGISLYPNDGSDPDTLLSNADAAMHEAKASHESYRFFSPDINASALNSLLLSSNMHAALERDEFRLHYQPVIDFATGTITGFEALVRWQHPKRGMVSPVDFIPLAEETGLIIPLGDWVMRQACLQTRAWIDQGHTGLRMAVNLSAVQFRDSHAVERIGEILDETGLPPSRLLVEITESIMLPNPDETRDILSKINNMGIPIAIDDFGTGYSSLAYLRDYSIDFLKVDRSFVKSLPEDENACTIVNTIVAMAKSLGLDVIAEGVETSGQFGFLRDSGCDEAQGFYFGKPMPAADAEALLEAQTAGAESR